MTLEESEVSECATWDCDCGGASDIKPQPLGRVDTLFWNCDCVTGDPLRAWPGARTGTAPAGGIPIFWVCDAAPSEFMFGLGRFNYVT